MCTLAELTSARDRQSSEWSGAHSDDRCSRTALTAVLPHLLAWHRGLSRRIQKRSLGFAKPLFFFLFFFFSFLSFCRTTWPSAPGGAWFIGAHFEPSEQLRGLTPMQSWGGDSVEDDLNICSFKYNNVSKLAKWALRLCHNLSLNFKVWWP